MERQQGIQKRKEKIINAKYTSICKDEKYQVLVCSFIRCQQYLSIINLFAIMRLLFQIALISLFFGLASCSVGIFTSENIPSVSTMQCILRSGFTFATWGEDSTSKGVESTVVNALINMKNAGLKTDLAFVPCKGLGATKEVQLFLQRVPINIVDRVWLVADDDSDQDICKWKVNNHKDNCDTLLEFANEFKKNRINVGIMSNHEDWVTYYGQCGWLQNERLFWDPETPNNDPSFSDFKPFGGWQRPSRKIYHFVANICGLEVSTAYEP